MKRYLSLLIGLLISAIFVYFAVRGLDFAAFWESLETANYWWIVPGVAVYFVGLWVRTWRWYYTLRHLKQMTLQRLFPLVCIGYFGNNVFPFRAGELLRSYALKQKEDVDISSSLATVFIERIFDGLVMLLFVFLALPFAPMPTEYRNAVIILTTLLIIATVLFVWMALQPERIEGVYCWVATRLLPKSLQSITDKIFTRFMEGLLSLSSARDILMIFATSIVIWLMETVKYWFVMFAFDFEVSFLALMLMNGIVNLATTLPSAPGHVGTFDTPGIAVLVAYGVNEAVATSYTLTLHLALWLPVTLVGGYYFLREGLRWGDFATADES
ncbi:MAG: lysylphosphatidylglycerol synthase transmembrane domain-containing protein [Chloroflexota bacterium]